MNNLDIIWAIIVFAPLLLGYLFSRIGRTHLRRLALVALALAPIWIWTAVELFSPPSYPSNHFDRWAFGLAVLVPVVAVWGIAAILAFALGRKLS